MQGQKEFRNYCEYKSEVACLLLLPLEIITKMKLDYIDQINEYGDNLIRLYDFSTTEADKFRKAVQQTAT